MQRSIPSLSLCLINHNGAGHLQRALAALREQEWSFSEILLVDNASNDASVDIVRRDLPEARVIQLPENLGPGVARNAGFRAASNDLILFHDNDVRLRPGTVEKLVEHLRKESGSLLVAPRVLYADQPGTVQYDSADQHFLGLMITRNADRPAASLDKAPHRTTSMVSACFLIDRTVWDDEDPFDETFVFNLEDHDFGVRASLLGHQLWVCPEAEVLHGEGSPGLSYRPGYVASDRRLHFLALHRWIVLYKTCARRTFVLLFPALVVFESMQLIWFIAAGKSRVWVRAVTDFRRARKSLASRRAAIQARRRVSDRAILRDAPLPITDAARGGKVSRTLLLAAEVLLRAYWRLVKRWL